jgi:hypothetical protein|tara:strand:- start:393 stop:698 length:306 start_codon:yes stop_codon:yes gene_type:complete
MVQVTVLRPYRCKQETKCSHCDLSYTKSHYKILFEGRKLVYFEIENKKEKDIICHGCFFNFLNKMSKSKKRKSFNIRFVNGHKKSKMEILPTLEINDLFGL